MDYSYVQRWGSQAEEETARIVAESWERGRLDFNSNAGRTVTATQQLGITPEIFEAALASARNTCTTDEEIARAVENSPFEQALRAARNPKP
jgi:hypothetical protein